MTRYRQGNFFFSLSFFLFLGGWVGGGVERWFLMFCQLGFFLLKFNADLGWSYSCLWCYVGMHQYHFFLQKK